MIKANELIGMFNFSNMNIFEKDTTIQVVLNDPKENYKNLNVFVDVLKMYKKHIALIEKTNTQNIQGIKFYYYTTVKGNESNPEKNNSKFTEYYIERYNDDVKFFSCASMSSDVWTNIGHLFNGAFLLKTQAPCTYKYISHKDYSIQECYDIYVSSGLYIKLSPETDFTNSKAKIVMKHLQRWTTNWSTNCPVPIYAVHTNDEITTMTKDKMLSLPHYIYSNDTIFVHNPDKKSVERSDNIINDIQNIGKDLSKIIDLGTGGITINTPVASSESTESNEKPVPPRELYIIVEYKNNKRDYIQYPIGDTSIDNIEEFRTLICDWAQSLSYEDKPFIPPMITAIEYRSKNCYNFRMLGVNDLVKLNNKEINEVLVKFDYNKF